MKLNKLVFPMVIALTAVLASTGCKKGFSKVTPLPGQGSNMVGNPNGDSNTIGNGNQLGGPSGFPETNPTSVPTGGGPTAPWDINSVTQDPSALAAYTVHFKFDSAVVQDNEQANISSVATALTSDPNAKLLIQGNCDERGTEEYNRALGERRALALREALAKLSIDPERIKTISFGKDKPVDTGHDEAAWAKNRRGDFILCHPKM